MDKIDSFRRAVNKHFAFLCQRGFSKPEESNFGVWDCCLKYSSSSVSITVSYGPPEFHAELGFQKKSTSTPENNFGLGDLIMAGHRPESWVAEAGTIGIESEVSWLASAIHAVENHLCSGDMTFYEMLASNRQSRTAQWHRKENLAVLRNKAAKAWEEKNWKQIVSIYQSITPELTAVEAKRLSYAEKKRKSWLNKIGF